MFLTLANVQDFIEDPFVCFPFLQETIQVGG